MRLATSKWQCQITNMHIISRSSLHCQLSVTHTGSLPWFDRPKGSSCLILWSQSLTAEDPFAPAQCLHVWRHPLPKTQGPMRQITASSIVAFMNRDLIRRSRYYSELRSLFLPIPFPRSLRRSRLSLKTMVSMYQWADFMLGPNIWRTVFRAALASSAHPPAF
jgi:hypothetical protein